MNEGADDQSLEPTAAPAAESSPVPFLIPTRFGDRSAEFSSLTRLVNDPRAITRLLHLLLERSGFTQKAIADSMGVRQQSLTQYFNGRSQPGLAWLIRFTQACGGDIVVHPKGSERL